MIERDTLENQVKTIYLGIGSNLGNKKSNIEKAKFELSKSGVRILQSSSYYESLSWPEKNNPKFYNIVLKVSTKLLPLELINICKTIEIKLGRRKNAKNAPRECDIDIIDFNSKKMSGHLILPHPRMHKRNFVLFPLFELDKNWKHPRIKRHIKSLILDLPNSEASTISGHILEIAKRIPLFGETVKDEYFIYKILSHSRKQISKIEINLLKKF